MTRKVFDFEGEFEGHELSSEEYAALTGDQFRDAIANYGHGADVIRDPLGNLTLIDLDDKHYYEDGKEGAEAA